MKGGGGGLRIVERAAMGVVALLFAAPLLWMLAGSLKADAAIHRDVDSLRSFVVTEPTAKHYGEAVRRGHALTTLANSFGVVVLVAVGGLVVNAPAAYAFARLRFPGRDMLFVALVATIIVPLEAIVIPLALGVQSTREAGMVLGERGWTLAALSVPFMAKAFSIFLLRQAFLSLPQALEEAAFLDGAGPWQTFLRVALPNIAPAVVTVVLLDFVMHWNDFLWPLVICHAEETRTVQLGLANFFTQPPISWGAILAYAVLATIPAAVVFLLGQRYLVASLASTGIRE